MRRTTFACVAALALCAHAALAQDSLASLRFHAMPGGSDRALIAIDDDAPGTDASSPADVGAGDFTIELWLAGTHADDPSPPSEPGSFADERWRGGRVVLDRGVHGASERTYAMALLDGRVAFFTGRGDGTQQDERDTTVGAIDVLDGAWHHVALVRDTQSGRKRVYVDGALDRESPPATSQADLSYPDAGLGLAHALDPFVCIAASKDDSSSGFAGRVDELRFWSSARAQRDVAALMRRRLLPDEPGLAAEFRFEEGQGTTLADSSDRHAAAGTLLHGVAGDGEWALYAIDAAFTAPIAGSLPAGFQRELLVGTLDHPTGFAFAPDGRLFVAQRAGKVLAWTNGALQAQPVCELAVGTGGERGLLGLCVDPAFSANGFLYAFHTTPAARNRVTRVTVAGAAADPASFVTIWETPGTVAFSHHGGSIGFGADGELYVATGDQFTPSNAQDLANVHGKLLRLHADGTVPSDNPFVLVAGARPEIWALGLRNPFRFRLDAPTGRLWLGDVGGNGPQAFEELDLVERGANYGWPLAEGPSCYQSDCSSLRASRFDVAHDDARFCPVGPQACIVAGPVYRGSAFPPEYQGNLFVGDYANGWLWRLVLDASASVVEAHPFELGNDTGAVVDLAEGPEGALYVLTHVRGTLARIRHGSASNLVPLAIADATPTAGVAPLAVQFHGSGASDPDAGPSPLAFTWLFGDGDVASEPDPVHVYAAPGDYRAVMLVGDGADVVRSDEIVVRVGRPPVPAIAAPLDGASYRAGDVIAFAGGAVDHEDGVLAPDRLTWRVVLVHEEHEHPVLGPLTGVASGSFVVPIAGESPEHARYRVELDALDADGLVATTSVEVLPAPAPFHLRTTPISIPLLLDGDPVTPPIDRAGLEGFVHRVEAPASMLVAGRSWVFDGWSTGAVTSAIDWIATPGGAFLGARYHLDEVAEVTSGVYAADRNAEWRASTGQAPSSPADAAAICVGREVDEIQAGFEFPLPLERDVEVLEARFTARAALDQAGAPPMLVRAYAAMDSPPFAHGSSVALTAFAPLATQSIAWSAPAFVAGELVESPDLAPIVQELVERADWIANDRIGLVITSRVPSGAWRCFGNFDSGEAPTLYVRWRTAQPAPILPPLRR